MNLYSISRTLGACILCLILCTSWSSLAIIYNARCLEQKLSIRQAKGRTEWAFRCKFIDSLKYSTALYSYDVITQVTQERTYPMYPVFTEYGEIDGKLWRAPVRANASCDIPDNIKPTQLFCDGGCFAPDQALWYAEGTLPIQQAYEAGTDHIMTLSAQATRHQLSYSATSVYKYTASRKEGWHTLLALDLSSGSTLKVSKDHPLINGQGRIIKASQLEPGMHLISAEGDEVQVISKSMQEFWGKLYHVQPKLVHTSRQKALLGQVIVAQGVLSGSSYLQNEGIDYMGAHLLRSSMDPHLLDASFKREDEYTTSSDP